MARWSVCLAWLAVLACGRGDPAPPAAAAPPAPAPGMAAPVGWWRSDELCFELFDNGDFEISLMSNDPKVQILGGAKFTPDGADRGKVALQIKRIWKARWVSRCRKHVELGHWIPSIDALGVTFTEKTAAPITVHRIADDQLEVCAKTCATLERETPALSGRWRRAGMESPTTPTVPWHAGDLLELDVNGISSHLWIGRDGGAFDRVSGTGKARYVSPDRFAITLESDQGTRELTAHRLPDERLELCAAPKQCATLERQFDSDSYDLR